MMWLKLILNFCLMVNFLLTVVAFLLLTEPDALRRWAKRRGGEAGFFDDEGGGEVGQILRLWTRWTWFVLVAWGLLTGFLIGLHWYGGFWWLLGGGGLFF